MACKFDSPKCEHNHVCCFDCKDRNVCEAPCFRFSRKLIDKHKCPEWTFRIRKNNCPVCGGELVMLSFYQVTRTNYIGVSGKILKKYKNSIPYNIGDSSIVCTNCGRTWNSDEFELDEKDKLKWLDV